MNLFFLYLMSLLYVVAGIYHFINPKFYRKMMPSWIPWHQEMIILSGLWEIVLGLLLLPVVTRSFAAWGIIVLLILIFPANIQMAINFSRKKNRWFWLSIARLPLQILLIGWAWLYTR